VDGGVLHLGFVRGLSAESFGEPGGRTFRIVAETESGRISLWLEKEQVVMLGSAVQELLDRLPDRYGREPAFQEGQAFVGDLEVRLGALSLAYDRGGDGFRLEATEFESPLPLSSIQLLASRDQLSEIQTQIDDIVSASRPRCVLCGTPLTGEPHFCPPSNGHAEVSAPE
jgi:uncharacterized repeat protein (TIGR03847 family)